MWRGLGLLLARGVPIFILAVIAVVAVMVASAIGSIGSLGSSGHGEAPVYVYGVVRVVGTIDTIMYDPLGHPILACDAVYVYVVETSNGSARVIAYSWLYGPKDIVSIVESCLGPWLTYRQVEPSLVRSIIASMLSSGFTVNTVVEQAVIVHRMVKTVNTTTPLVGEDSRGGAGTTSATSATVLVTTSPVPSPTPKPPSTSGGEAVSVRTVTKTVTSIVERSAERTTGEEFSGEKAVVVLLAGVAGATLAYMLWRTRLWRSVTP